VVQKLYVGDPPIDTHTVHIDGIVISQAFLPVRRRVGLKKQHFVDANESMCDILYFVTLDLVY
jgi:hypothetical protein